MRLTTALAALAMVAMPASAMAATAPKLAATSFDVLPKPLPLPYNETADAHADVAKAKALAKKQHKLLLLDLGGNWCPDCRILAGTLELPDLAPWVAKHYVVVTVDVGRYTKNLDIGAAYGIDRPKGVPAVFIVDPKTDKLINTDHVTALSDARHMSPQALADWLAGWVK